MVAEKIGGDHPAGATQNVVEDPVQGGPRSIS